MHVLIPSTEDVILYAKMTTTEYLLATPHWQGSVMVSPQWLLQTFICTPLWSAYSEPLQITSELMEGFKPVADRLNRLEHVPHIITMSIDWSDKFPSTNIDEMKFTKTSEFDLIW